jgi:hypothetical protein
MKARQSPRPQGSRLNRNPAPGNRRNRMRRTTREYGRPLKLAGHLSRAILSPYSHARMEAKRSALDAIAARQRATDQ